MVESPQAILFEPLTSEGPDTKLDHKGDVEPELLLVKPQPITSSFKSTIRHLRSRDGKRGFLRGFAMNFIKNSVLDLQMNFFSIFLPTIFAFPIATILCAPFSLAWTHIVISDSSPLPWYKRMPDLATIKKVMPATAVYALAREAVYFLPGYLAVSFGLIEPDFSDVTRILQERATTMGMETALVALLTLSLGFLVYIPAIVTLTRVQASLLADNLQPIVPFDRTFGGRVSEDGVLGVLDAWSTFDWNSRIRLLKTYVKACAMEIAVATFFTVIIFAQAVLILGSECKKIIPGTGIDGYSIQFDS